MGVKKLIEALENSIRRSIDRNKLENLFQSAIEQLYRVERNTLEESSLPYPFHYATKKFGGKKRDVSSSENREC